MSARRFWTAAEITSWWSKTTNPTCNATSPPTSSRPFPPYTEKQRQAQLTEASTKTKEHGRRVSRHLQASTRVVPHLAWPGAAQVCRLERITRRNGKKMREVHYAITSLP